MNWAALAPVMAFVMVLVVGAALRPAPLPRTCEPADFELITTGTEGLAAPEGRGSPATRWRIRRWAARREPTADAMAAATWCDELARALRSGATLAAALRTSPSPIAIAPLVASMCLSLDRGLPVGDALRQAQSASPHVNMVLTVLRACAEHGGPAGEPLDRTAATLRVRAADRADRLTQSAQARMSAVVMTCLPVAMLALMMLTSASVRGAVFSPVGITAVAAGAVLNAAGWLWMRHTIDSDAS